jgi:hypothetical protein
MTIGGPEHLLHTSVIAGEFVCRKARDCLPGAVPDGSGCRPRSEGTLQRKSPDPALAASSRAAPMAAPPATTLAGLAGVRRADDRVVSAGLFDPAVAVRAATSALPPTPRRIGATRCARVAARRALVRSVRVHAPGAEGLPLLRRRLSAPPAHTARAVPRRP